MEALSRAVSFPCDLRVYNYGFQTVIASIQPPNGLGFMTRVGSEIEVAPSASGLVLLAFQDPIIKEIRIKESLPNQSETEIEAFRNSLKEIAIKGFASIQSKQYAGLHAIAFPILDMNGNAIAAMTVPMLARIDGTNQFTQEQVENLLRESVLNLSRKLAISDTNTHK
jgi:DNA-binding IclR family transcriptional regulator